MEARIMTAMIMATIDTTTTRRSGPFVGWADVVEVEVEVEVRVVAELVEVDVGLMVVAGGSVEDVVESVVWVAEDEVVEVVVGYVVVKKKLWKKI